MWSRSTRTATSARSPHSPPTSARVDRTLADLLPHLEHIDSVSDVLAYVSQLPSGLHVLAAPEQAEVMAAMTPETYGDLLDLLGRFYEVILLDLGTGIIDPLAQFGIRRADQALLVTTPEYVTADKVLGALRYLNAEAGWDSGDEEESLNRKRLTVVLNRAPSERSGDRKVIESAFRRFGIGRHVTIPYDDRLRVMLDSATYSLARARPLGAPAGEAARGRRRRPADLSGRAADDQRAAALRVAARPRVGVPGRARRRRRAPAGRWRRLA